MLTFTRNRLAKFSFCQVRLSSTEEATSPACTRLRPIRPMVFAPLFLIHEVLMSPASRAIGWGVGDVLFA